jgi:hypothetical protein
MKKEYKEFYRFLWEYLDGDNSALIIKPRQCGMTNFAARYAAWCLDYKDTAVKSIGHRNNRDYLTCFWDMVEKYRCVNFRGNRDQVRNWDTIIPEDHNGNIIVIADEIEWMDMSRLECSFSGLSAQILAFSSIKDCRGISKFIEVAYPCHIKKGCKFETFNISDTHENKYKFEKVWFKPQG